MKASYRCLHQLLKNIPTFMVTMCSTQNIEGDRMEVSLFLVGSRKGWSTIVKELTNAMTFSIGMLVS